MLRHLALICWRNRGISAYAGVAVGDCHTLYLKHIAQGCISGNHIHISYTIFNPVNEQEVKFSKTEVRFQGRIVSPQPDIQPLGSHSTVLYMILVRSCR
jgi:hypothetical protein